MKRFVGRLSWTTLVVGLVLQLYLRVYPWFHTGCAWPAINSAARYQDVKIVAFGDPQITGYSPLQRWRKRLDIFGNDLFLKQVASTMRRRSQPDLVAVMGDLLSSQWITDDEFHRRVDRFERIFPLSDPGQLVNISGNHDIGYHGEFTDGRLDRFVQRFGELNYVVNQTEDNETGMSYRIIVLNSLSLDGPPYDDAPQKESRAFLKSLEGFSGTTVLLTHIPLYKPAGVCRDGPSFDFYSEDFGSVLKQQNHLSQNASNLVLNSVFASGQGGLIVAGHDHEGCFMKYKIDQDGEWVPQIDTRPDTVGDAGSTEVKEFTVKSIMGEYGGNSGLIYGRVSSQMRMEWTYSLCRFHQQHIWWVTQVVTIIGMISIPLLYFL